MDLGGGVIARRDHPQLTGALEWLVRRRELVPVLPGVYARPDQTSDRMVRLRAAAARHRDGVLLGGAAARLTYWPEAPAPRIEMAVRRDAVAPPGFAFTKRFIPPELVVEREGFRLTAPALTAIDLADLTCCDAIDNLLRSRTETLDGLYEALRLTPYRAGNVDRRRVLLDSRGQPWSAAERQTHRELRSARIGGWKANLKTMVAGSIYFIDVAFEAQRTAVEIDGRLHEDDVDLFESDRRRQNALVVEGWKVLRFTWPMVRDEPQEMCALIRRVLR